MESFVSANPLAPGAERGAVLNENRARQAVPLGHVRYVLITSLALYIIEIAEGEEDHPPRCEAGEGEEEEAHR